MNFIGQDRYPNKNKFQEKVKHHKSNRTFVDADEYRIHELRAIRRRKTIARVSFIVLCIVAALMVIAVIMVYDGCVD